MERMVAELMVKQKVKGELSDWVPGVTDEFDTVTDLRLEAVSEETAQQVLESGNHMKLRMILEEKKGRSTEGSISWSGFLEGCWCHWC